MGNRGGGSQHTPVAGIVSPIVVVVMLWLRVLLPRGLVSQVMEGATDEGIGEAGLLQIGREHRGEAHDFVEEEVDRVPAGVSTAAPVVARVIGGVA